MAKNFYWQSLPLSNGQAHDEEQTVTCHQTAVGDINHDGLPDVAMHLQVKSKHPEGTKNYVVILLGNGDRLMAAPWCSYQLDGDTVAAASVQFAQCISSRIAFRIKLPDAGSGFATGLCVWTRRKAR